MANKQVKEKKQPVIQTRKRADGTTEVIVTKSPQNTLAGKIVIGVLAAALALGSIVSLIIVLAQA